MAVEDRERLVHLADCGTAARAVTARQPPSSTAAPLASPHSRGARGGGGACSAAVEEAAKYMQAVVVADLLPPAGEAAAAQAKAAMADEAGAPMLNGAGPTPPVGKPEAARAERPAAGAAAKRSKRAPKAKKAWKARVPADEEAEEVVEEEVELPAYLFQDAIQQKKRQEEKAGRKKMNRRIERLPVSFEYRLHGEHKMKEIGKQLDYVQRQIQEAPAWIERAEDLERRNPDGLNPSKQMRKNLQIMVKFPPGSRIYKHAKHMLQTWKHRSLEQLLEDARDELMVFESESEGEE
ncbi:unnamed protein product [Symbiodinium sp. KB8]|nr:unnamed protein product [Symbiodinium sp. KB8]